MARRKAASQADSGTTTTKSNSLTIKPQMLQKFDPLTENQKLLL